MMAVMTESERALWIAAKLDYERALAIAVDTWKMATNSDGAPEPTSDTIQAATATLLIHLTKLRQEERIHVRVPQSTAPAAVTREVISSQAPVAVPPCKKCGGPMKDVRGEKRGEKSPDFVCQQVNGDCGKPNKDKTKWFPTAQWVEKPVSNGGNVRPNALAGQTAPHTFEQPPVALQDEGGDDLPFRSGR